MSLFEFAKQYVTEHYADQVDDDQPLSKADEEALEELVTRETHRMHGMLTMACEAWATDADIFEPEEGR